MARVNRAKGKIRWTNPSVAAFAGAADPVQAVSQRARQIVTEALDEGWDGPPFDPLLLADRLGIAIVARDDVLDARTVIGEAGRALIEYNPTRPRGRVRYSIAHEIAHTLFPDWSEKVRNRTAHHDLEGDEWQLEALCNIAAAEFVMPLGSFRDIASSALTIDTVLEQQRQFDVSMEAILIRTVHVHEENCAMFAASARGNLGTSADYTIDYLIGSRSWTQESISRGLILPKDSVVRDCFAIGYTAKGEERWGRSDPLRVETVGIPPYPGSKRPRVVGLLEPADAEEELAPRDIEYVIGDVTSPGGHGERMIVHVVTDAAVTWGGGGAAAAVRRAWPAAQDAFREWVGPGRQSLKLGNVHFVQVGEHLSVASVIAQHGYGQSTRPRVRYAALRAGLERVALECSRLGASAHMPRIGCGLAGGSWDIVEELIEGTLGRADIPVTVYDLRGSPTRRAPSDVLRLSL